MYIYITYLIAFTVRMNMIASVLPLRILSSGDIALVIPFKDSSSFAFSGILTAKYRDWEYDT